jgi:G3E family GTPase
MPTAATEPRLPVHVLTGFLGAGKTTLLNRLLADSSLGRIAVVVNEFGDVGIDGRLVVGADEELIELSNGCVCCRLRGDLVQSLVGLLERRSRRLLRQPFERVAIETSGLASPGPIVQTLLVEGRLSAALAPAGVVTVCHAALIEAQLARHPEAAQQVACADRLLIGHTDRVDAEALAALCKRLAGRNPLATLHLAERGQVNLAELLASLDPRRIALADPALDALSPWSPRGQPVAHTLDACALVLESEQAIDLHRLKLWLRLISLDRSHELWRLKGLLRIAQSTAPLLVQGVEQFLEIGPLEGIAPQRSSLVLIGKRLDRAALERGFAALTSSP